MEFDYHQPNYVPVYEQRAKRLEELRNNPELLANLKLYYRCHPWDFVNDWGVTFEPRNIETGLIPNIPMILWPRQKAYLDWLLTRWQQQERGLVEKSRDCGVTWLSVGFAVSMWLFNDGFTVGFGSRKEELLDRKGDHKSIFEKIRFFIDHLPLEFTPEGFNERQHCAHMKVINPSNGATITGEAGDEIGRGGRSSIYFVDEAAFIERQERVDAALSQNTNCQIDISTPNGNGNAFYRKRKKFQETNHIFVFDWRDDPRKTLEWYEKQLRELDATTVAQEIDRDYNASDEDTFIPAIWIQASIDAHVRLGIDSFGERIVAFDPADVGDAKSVVCRSGVVITQAKQLKAGDITHAIPWALQIAQEFRADLLVFDGDGMGTPSMKLALKDKFSSGNVIAYRGSGSVKRPYGRDGAKGEGIMELPRNKDRFQNRRAQSWHEVRERFRKTHEAVTRSQQGFVVTTEIDELISIDSNCEELHELVAEISRPRRLFSQQGKVKVESKQDMRKRGVTSPNLADALVMAASSAKRKEQPKRLFATSLYKDRSVGY